MSTQEVELKKYWIDSHAARMTVGMIVIVNAIVMGVLTFVDGGSSPLHGFLQDVERTIAGIFIVEMVLRLAAHRRLFFKSGWNIFDFLVVFGSLIPLGGESLRALRILRLFYFIEISKKLRHILHGIYYAMPGFLSVTLLLLITFYVYAVIGVNLYKHAEVEAFQNLVTSFHTLFQVLTGDDWYAVLRTVMKQFPYAWIYFYAYYVSMVFIILNLFIGVIVNALQNAEEDLEHPLKEKDNFEEKIFKEINDIKREVQRIKRGEG